MKLFLSLTLLSLSVFGQTKTDVANQVKASTAANTVYVSVPGVGFVPALLGSNLVLTNNSGVYTLNSNNPSATLPPIRNNVTKTANNSVQSFTTTNALTNGDRNNLEVFRNGILQTEFEDYTVSVNIDGTVTVSFLQNVVSTADIIRLRYF